VSLPTDPVLPLFVLTVEPWADPVVDELGVDPRAPYVERFWLPVLGPSTVLFLRRVADRLDDEPDGFTLDLTDTARSLGVGMRSGRNAPILKTVERCCRFGAARMWGHDVLSVRRRLAPLNRAQVERLPEGLRAEHADWQARPDDVPVGEQMRRRARQLALSLLELGESAEACERQLHHWRFHPAVAFDAVRWARATHLEGTPPEEPRPAVPPRRAPAGVAAAVAARAEHLSSRAATAGPGPSSPGPVPTLHPTPGSRSARPPLPRVVPPRPPAAGGPSVSERDGDGAQ
jgi:hypothetical protein